MKLIDRKMTAAIKEEIKTEVEQMIAAVRVHHPRPRRRRSHDHLLADEEHPCCCAKTVLS